jgi:hypothetical protein
MEGHENLRKLLLAAVPVLARPAPLPPVLQPTTCAAIMAHLGNVAAFERLMALAHHSQSKTNERARPDQGGQHITEEWLRSLNNRECEWRFRSISFPATA